MACLPCSGRNYSVEVGRYITAADSADEMLRHPGGDARRLRIFFELLRGADEVGVAAIQLVAAVPPLVGDRRFEPLLGAAAEYVAVRLGQPAATMG